MQTRSSKPSTKPPDDRSSGTAGPGDRRWRVKFHREPAKVVARYDPSDPTFRPTVGEIIEALAADPKQFKKKHGKLDGCRALDATFRDALSGRAVFEIDEPARTVRVLAFGPHDTAYIDAMRRRT